MAQVLLSGLRVTDQTPAGGGGGQWTMDNGQWTMDNGQCENGQCENLADDTMASYHEVPYLFIRG
ncbi:MAG: hypothetical protein LBB49_05605 [Gracilibacteraceae bacterium]|nr:hypothetical protein [Gracilibacteraceae bacterium]